MKQEHDLEYYQLRLCQLIKAWQAALVAYDEGSAASICAIIKDVHYCKRKIVQRYRQEVELNKHNEVMY